jgi:hypothetical protein
MKAILQNRNYTAKSKTINIVSGGTATITDTDTPPNVLYNVPAGNTQAIPSSVITLVDTDNAPISTTPVLATQADTITAPNGSVTARNSALTPLGSVAVKSNGTAFLPIADTRINKSDGVQIKLAPSGVPTDIADAPVRVEYVNGTLISNTNVLATTATTIQVPNPVVCETLDELVASSTTAEVFTAIDNAGKECSIQRLLLNQYGTNKYMSGGMYGVTGNNSIGTTYQSIGGVGYIFQCNNTVITIYNATTQVDTGVTITGFGRAAKIAFNGSTMAVADLTNNRIYLYTVVNASTFTPITNFATGLTATFTVEFNQAGTELYVGSNSTGTSISRFNLAGVLQGTVTGNDTAIVDMVRSENELWVLMATGTSGASTQRIRKIDMATNTQISTHSLGTVNTIGRVQAFAISTTNIFVLTGLNGMSIYNYTNAVALVNNGVLALSGGSTFGLAFNPLLCNCLVVPVSLTAVLTHVIYP